MFWDKFSSSTLQTGRNSQITQIRYRRREGGVMHCLTQRQNQVCLHCHQKLHLIRGKGILLVPRQGMWAWSLVLEGITCHGAAKPVCATPTESALFWILKEGLLTSPVHNIFHYLPNISVKSKSSHWLILYLTGIKIPPTSKWTPDKPNVLSARLELAMSCFLFDFILLLCAHHSNRSSPTQSFQI